MELDELLPLDARDGSPAEQPVDAQERQQRLGDKDLLGKLRSNKQIISYDK